VKALVVGGYGFYGAKVVAALRARGHEVRIGARRPRGPGDVAVDLGDPATFEALAGHDVIVDCADSVNAPPDAAIRHVREHGGVWLEMGADVVSLRRMLAARDPGPGTVLLGVGVFPGLSTLLARKVARAGTPARSVELGISLSPLSGAGLANCSLMAASLFVPATWIDGDVPRSQRLALGPPVALPFSDRRRDAITLSLPDTELIARATGAPRVVAGMALVPSWLRLNFLVLAWWAVILRPLQGAVVWVLARQLALVRAWLLRGVESSLELVVIADRGAASERIERLRFDDGQAATAAGVVAVVEAVARHEELPAGTLGVAEVFELDEVWPLRPMGAS
jgi:hypothetical protein